LTVGASFIPGALVKDYRLSRSRVRQILLIMCLTGGMASVCLLPALFEPNETLVTRLGVGLLGLLFLTPVFVGIYTLLRFRGVSLTLYENGLIYRKAGKEYAVGWDQVATYVQDVACRITRVDGQVIEFGHSVEGLDEIAAVVQEETLKLLLPQVEEAIESGAAVQFEGLKPFGSRPRGRFMNRYAYATPGFSADLHGITWLEDNQRIPWGDVREFGIVPARMGRITVDVFVIRGSKAAFQTRLGLLTNAHVLLSLLMDMTGLEPLSTN
jgi:hypothetical protein